MLSVETELSLGGRRLDVNCGAAHVISDCPIRTNALDLQSTTAESQRS